MRALNISIQFTVATLFSISSVASAVSPRRIPTSEVRMSHARELLGSSYKQSVVRKSEKTADVSAFVREATKKFLPAAHKDKYQSVANAILSESDRYGFDPLFLVALIQNESSFNPNMKGSFGEIGLMQIKPDTAKWIAATLHLNYAGAKSLYDPATNIRFGTAFINKLRTDFSDQSRLYLSAYNSGAKKVRNLASINKAPKSYVIAVMKRYIAMYAALNSHGDWKNKSQLAWNNIRDINLKH